MKTDTTKLHDLIRNHEWYDAAVLLLGYCQYREDPQDWLSHGDARYMLSHTIEELAAAWDDAVRLAE